MNANISVLFVLKRPYTWYYMICMTVPLMWIDDIVVVILFWISQLEFTFHEKVILKGQMQPPEMF